MIPLSFQFPLGLARAFLTIQVSEGVYVAQLRPMAAAAVVRIGTNL